MARIEIRACAAFLLVAAICGCGKESEPATSTAAVRPAPAAGNPKAPSPALAFVDQSLKAGEFDNAAAQLLQMRAAGKEFSDREAADYRRAMNEAYSRAVEAAAKGDPRAQAAIQMIRAANNTAR